MGQKSRVEHVGVCNDKAGGGTDAAAGRDRRVAVVDRHFPLSTRPETVQEVFLVPGQGLGGKKVQGGGPGLLEQRVEDRQVVGQGFPRGRRRGDDGVPTLPHQLPDPVLVGIEAVDAPVGEGAAEAGVEFPGQRGPGRGVGGKGPEGGHASPRGIAAKLFEDLREGT